MIEKILTGGREGVEQSALDLAIELNIPHGGWIPVGSKKALPSRYRLREVPEGESGCMKKNIRFSDGTLLFIENQSDDAAGSMCRWAGRLKKPFLAITLEGGSRFEVASQICKWMMTYHIKVLNISGETAPNSSICKAAMDILESAIYLCHIEYDAALSFELPLTKSDLPDTVARAVTRLVSELPLKDKVVIANMGFSELVLLDATLGKYIRDSFGLRDENPRLMTSCRTVAGDEDLGVENASDVIIQHLWEALKDSHRLRIIK
ncbi:MAG: putative molybdenum carrier protein [Desulfobacterales bacterium]